MSGIAGWVDIARDISVETVCVERMTRSLAHRGPDREGIWTSSRAAIGYRGHGTIGRDVAEQPMLFETGQGAVVLAYAGYIDNRANLRRKLGIAEGLNQDNEAEVILRAYLKFGIEFARELSGGFAIAIWDGRSEMLLLVRDRLGIQPLYYYPYCGGLLFGSEPKAIIANPLFKPRLNLQMLPILLQPRLALPGETPLVDLAEVPQAHVVIFHRGALTRYRYWQLHSEPHTENFADTVEHVHSLLSDIVTRQVRISPMPGTIGAMLSGGLDSTSVAALTARALRQTPEKDFYTFCVRFESDSANFTPTDLRPDIDAPYAALAAMHIGCLHKTITARTDEVIAAIPNTRPPRDLPGWGQFDASMLLLFKEMRKYCQVAVTGECADELFGGYPHFFDPAKIALGHFPWIELGEDKLSAYMSSDMQTTIDPVVDERARYDQLLTEVPRLHTDSPEEARMREMLYVSMCGRLSVLLDRMDRMAMAAGLEMRLPFCDHELLQYVWNVPWSMKTQGGVKGLLKAAMKDILPDSTVNRKKSAYPHIQNPLYDETILEDAQRILNDKSSPTNFLFDKIKLDTRINNIRAGKAGVNAAHMFIQMIETDCWMREYGVTAQ